MMSDETDAAEMNLREAEFSSGEQWIREGSASLKQMKRGLDLVYFGIGLVVVSILAALYLLLTSRLPMVSMTVLPFVGLLGYLMIFVGPILCLSAPEESGTRGLLVGSAVGLSANLIYYGTDFFDPGFLTMPMRLFLKLASVVGLILFVLFIKKLTMYINRPDLTAKAQYLLVTTVLLLMGVWLVYFLEHLRIFFNVSPLIITTGIIFALVIYTYIVGSIKEELISPS
ncbi:hypothetical protein [Gimesia alba]|nr:hypothetical protein [Gimesia alba]